MYGSTFYIPVKLELLFSVGNINIATPTHDSGLNRKYFIAWHTVTDVDIYKCTNTLD